MSCCPPHCCSRCREEVCQERIAWKAEAKRKDICSIGPIPEINHDSDEDSEPDTVSPEETISIEEGDRILATGLLLSLFYHLSTASGGIPGKHRSCNFDPRLS